MKKIDATKSFLKKLEKLEKKNIYSLSSFKSDIKLFFDDELNPKFRRHKIGGYKKDVFSITLGYDLRALYFFYKQKIRLRNGIFIFGYLNSGGNILKIN